MAKNETYSDGKLVTPVGIAFFVSLVEPKVWDPNKPNKREISIAIPVADKAKLLPIKEAENELIKTCFKGKNVNNLVIKERGSRKTYDPYPLGIESNANEKFYVIKATTKFMPGVCLYDKTPLTLADIREGNKIRMSIKLAAGDNAGNRYVRALLLNIQKVGEGSGLPEGLGFDVERVEDAFDEIEGESIASGEW